MVYAIQGIKHNRGYVRVNDIWFNCRDISDPTRVLVSNDLIVAIEIMNEKARLAGDLFFYRVVDSDELVFASTCPIAFAKMGKRSTPRVNWSREGF